ncbi:MAG TPA: tRNA (adenosine(37)-N6)-threonylcarbamoyltransferase complex dimerization subunit type 1 TsaB [Eudoraea sp.]|nr:tRNA (adenosine(37)-N6)-threonylcarbamoyltransferase complex dimerization subunit type 1 TsaB [Eudoraea sp.]
MATILNLETATTNCSVSVAKNGTLLALKEHNSANYSHSEQLHHFIKTTLEEARVAIENLDGIAVSKGPGSYTGLRIGVSAAKGLCFSLDLPLISVPTLESMAHQIKINEGVIIPVLDARRMEVYSCVFDQNHKMTRETRAEIVSAGSFLELAQKGSVYIIGSGAAKCEELFNHPNFKYDHDLVPSAAEMCLLSHRKFEHGDLEDLAYFEPFYLKDFILKGKRTGSSI